MKKLLFIFILGYYLISVKMVMAMLPEVCDNTDGHCEKKWSACTEERPLRDKYKAHCVSCDYEGGLFGGTVFVNSVQECLVCPNRKVIQENDEIFCVLKKAPKWASLVVKYGYQPCGYCATDIEDCSKCLDDFEVIDGKCKRKAGRSCIDP